MKAYNTRTGGGSFADNSRFGPCMKDTSSPACVQRWLFFVVLQVNWSLPGGEDFFLSSGLHCCSVGRSEVFKPGQIMRRDGDWVGQKGECTATLFH